MNTTIICSIGKDTGAYVRGKYLARALSANGLRVNYLNTFNSMPLGLFYLLSMPVYLFKILFKKTDFIICLKPYPNTLLPAFIKKIFGAKVIVDVDDLDVGRGGFFIGSILKVFQKIMLKKSNLVLVHNDHLLSLLVKGMGVNPKNILRIQQGVDLDIFRPLKNRNALRMQKGFFSSEKLIVYTGHLNVAAHLEEIFSAFKLLTREIDSAKLIIVGGGPDEALFRKMVKNMGIDNKVIFTGHISVQENIVEYLNIADACTVYYPAEEFNRYRSSMKIREYLAVGVPSVCNEFGDLAQFKQFTYSFKTGDIRGFKNKMKIAVVNPDGREKKGMLFVRKNMSWRNIASGIKGAMEKC